MNSPSAQTLGNQANAIAVSAPSLDDIVLSTLDRRSAARKRARDERAIALQLKETRAMLGNPGKFERDEQNAAIVRLVALCGSENNAAVRLGRKIRVVQIRCFEASDACADMRRLWPETETSLLMAILAKAKAQPDRFDRYVRPFLDERMGQRILRSDFCKVWERALNDGLLPQEKMAREKVEAEGIADMAMTEASAMEHELEAVRADRAALEAKVAALENALAHAGMATGVDVLADMAQDMENLLRGKYSPSLEGLLRYAERMLSDRVMILPSAWKSAAESDKAGFSPVEPVADLLFKLARECVDQYRQGGHFLPGSVLGTAYADSEGHGPMTDAGFKRRTFSYNGKTVPMMAHLKIGTGWNKGTTFRAHFCFDAEIGKVVIGHFGKHLDR